MRNLNRVCVGRGEVASEVLASAVSAGAVLLFGGRQAGKTTLLQHIATSTPRNLRSTSSNVIVVPVYIDLMRLPYDAKPNSFFETLGAAGAAACALSIDSFTSPVSGTLPSDSLDGLSGTLVELTRRAGGVDVQFVFLLDESKRVLGSRFPRGFQDNLFALVFGDGPAADRCSLVFAGAQELYAFCEDDTSPIGSRAAKVLLTPLPSTAVGELMTLMVPSVEASAAEGITAEMMDWTGGHAGLVSYLCDMLRRNPDRSVSECARVVRGRHSSLFAIWRQRLSAEARVIHDATVRGEHLTRRGTGRLLFENGLDPLCTDRAREELIFTGIAREDGGALRCINRLYAESVRDVVPAAPRTARESEAWALIGEVELAARRFVAERYATAWPDGGHDAMRRILGDEACKRIERLRRQSGTEYAGVDPTREFLECAYLGQLGQLMLSNDAWGLFKSVFVHKTALQGLLAPITKVRNGFAHFREVEAHDLQMCRVAAEDLLALIEGGLASP